MDDETEVDGLEVVDTVASELEEETLPTLTYHVKNGRILEMTDGREAMVQAVDKILKTDRFTYPIYDEQYGNDFSELFGKDFEYAKIEVQRMLEEALFADDRITDVEVDDIQQTGPTALTVTGTATTIYGDLPIESEVAIESGS